MFLLVALVLILTNYVVHADMPQNSKLAYYIVVTVICLLVILTKIF